MKSMLRILLPVCLLWFLSAPPASATCLGLGCSCDISAASINFGAFNPLSAANVDVVGDIEVTCSALVTGLLVSYEVTLSSGSSGNQTSRSMQMGANTLSYNLFIDPARTTVWGDGTGGTGTISNSYLLSLLNGTDNFPVYSRLFGGQNIPPGSYTDTIVATVIF